MFEACIDMGACDGAFFVYRKEELNARYSHECGECGGAIEPGDRFELCVAVEEDETTPFVFYTCKICLAVLDDFTTGSARTYSTLWDEMREIYDICSPSDIPEWDDEEEEFWVNAKRKEAGLEPLPPEVFEHGQD